MIKKMDKKEATAAAFKQIILEHDKDITVELPEEFLDALSALLSDAYHIGYEAGREAERKEQKEQKEQKEKEDQTC